MYTRLIALSVIITISHSTLAQLSLPYLIEHSTIVKDLELRNQIFTPLSSLETVGFHFDPYIENTSSYVERAAQDRVVKWTHDLDTTANYVYVGAHLFGWESVIYGGGTRSSNYNDYYLPQDDLPIFTFPLLKTIIKDYYSYSQLSETTIINVIFTSSDKTYIAIVTGHSYPYGNQTSWDKHEYYYFKKM